MRAFTACSITDDTDSVDSSLTQVGHLRIPTQFSKVSPERLSGSPQRKSTAFIACTGSLADYEVVRRLTLVEQGPVPPALRRVSPELHMALPLALGASTNETGAYSKTSWRRHLGTVTHPNYAQNQAVFEIST